MKRLSIEQVKALNGLLIVETDGKAGIRDEALLRQTVDAPWQTFDGEDVCRSLEAKAARLAFGIIVGRPLAGSNTKTGMLTMLTLMEINGVTLHCTDEEIVDAAKKIESEEMTQGQLLEWIREHH